MAHCYKCGQMVCADEEGLNMKLISRDVTEFMCTKCLAEYFGCTEEFLKVKIEHFRNMGCLLFTTKQ